MSTTRKNVVTRFAPSPTGLLHLGGLRTALYNYLFARKHGGRFLLRIEDTDTKRTQRGAEDYIMRCLYHFGLKPDNLVTPEYRQSARYAPGSGMLRDAIDTLVSGGMAYWAYDTPEHLDACRRVKGWSYNALSRADMANELNPSFDGPREHAVLRFKMPAEGVVGFEDVIRGRVTFDCKDLDDKVLVKSDGMPTYHLANVLDDWDMGVTHVIRGEEWVSSTPLHVMLYSALGYDRPVYAHLPLILSPSGGKLSKRNGIKQGIDVFPLYCHFPDEKTKMMRTNKGYEDFQPEAFLNYLALLGWAPKGDDDVLTLDQLVDQFELSDVNKAGMKFDSEKLRAINAKHVRKMSDADIKAYLKKESMFLDVSDEKNAWLFEKARERSVLITDLYSAVEAILEDPDTYTRLDHLEYEAMDYITLVCEKADFDEPAGIKAALDEYGGKRADLMRCLRQVLTGGKPGPELEGIMWYLGPDVMLRRVNTARNRCIKMDSV